MLLQCTFFKCIVNFLYENNRPRNSSGHAKTYLAAVYKITLRVPTEIRSLSLLFHFNHASTQPTPGSALIVFFLLLFYSGDKWNLSIFPYAWSTPGTWQRNLMDIIQPFYSLQKGFRVYFYINRLIWNLSNFPYVWSTPGTGRQNSNRH